VCVNLLCCSLPSLRSLCSLLFKTIDAFEIPRLARLEREFCNRVSAITALPIALVHGALSIPPITAPSAPFRVAITAQEVLRSSRLKRQFRNGIAAVTAFPISSKHNAVNYTSYFLFVCNPSLYWRFPSLGGWTAK